MTKKQTNDAERGDYLAAVLQLDPLRQADQILRRRREYFGTPVPVDEQPAADHAEAGQRLQATTALDAVRTSFWTLDQEHLVQALNSLNVAPFPDLQVAAARLHVVARHRSDIAENLVVASKCTAADREVIDRLRRLWVSSARDALLIKQEFLNRLSHPEVLLAARRVVSVLRRQFPDLHRLEADWIDLFLPPSRRDIVRLASKSESTTSSSPHWVWLLVAASIVSQLARLLRLFEQR